MSPTVPLCPRRLSVLYLINLSELEMARRLTEISERPETEIKILRLDVNYENISPLMMEIRRRRGYPARYNFPAERH